MPIAIIAVVLTLVSKPSEERNPARIDMRGAVLVSSGMGLTVLGLQQASVWGWDSVATWLCLIAGLALLVAFVLFELRTDEPLVPLRLFADRGFLVDNIVLFLLSICFVPLFFFASLYAQIALGESASNAGLVLLVFFGGFSIAAQRGGRILDSQGARPSVVPGCAIAAVGFWLWGESLDDLSFSSQWYYLAIAGAGVGLVLGPVSTDALNRAARATYGSVTGVTQTVRNFGGSLGLAVLGSILITENLSRIERTLNGRVPKAQADKIAHAISGASSGAGGSGSGGAPPHQIRLDFAHSTQTVIYGMAGAMALAFVVALRAMPGGKAEQAEQAEQAEAVEAAGHGSGEDSTAGAVPAQIAGTSS